MFLVFSLRWMQIDLTPIVSEGPPNFWVQVGERRRQLLHPDLPVRPLRAGIGGAGRGQASDVGDDEAFRTRLPQLHPVAARQHPRPRSEIS